MYDCYIKRILSGADAETYLYFNKLLKLQTIDQSKKPLRQGKIKTLIAETVGFRE